jgi:hypothetical protein
LCDSSLPSGKTIGADLFFFSETDDRDGAEMVASLPASATAGFQRVHRHGLEKPLVAMSRTPLHVLTYLVPRYLHPATEQTGAGALPLPPVSPEPARWKP